MTYDQQLNELLNCRDKEEAQVWLMREIRRYVTDYRKEAGTARRQIIHNVMNRALARGWAAYEKVVVLLMP